jgi:hypothetical protein
MQIVENWTDIEGKVKEIEPSDVADDFVKVKLEVSQAKPVEGFADLHKEAEGQTLTVEVPKAAAEHLKAGAEISARVRRATNKRSFAHPDLVKTVKP